MKDTRIFIVEDNLENRAITQMILERQGAKTAIDRFGLETVERLHDFAPVDLVILDLMLPDKVTGYDILRQIRADAAFKDVKVVALSAADPAEELDKVQAAGFDGYLTKPIDFVRFPQQIADILDGATIWIDEHED